MRHITSFSIPKPQSTALVAVIGNEGANKGFWRRQWRDRYKRFVDMGRSIKFKVRLADGRVVNVIGKFEGSNDSVFGRVYVQGDPNVPDGYYYVSSDNGSTVIATLKQEDLDRMGIQPGKDYEGNEVSARDEAAIQDIGSIKYEPKELGVAKPVTERKENLSGSEVQERKLSTVTQNLKEEGRFPVPRQTNTNFWGEESDIAKGAKEDYNLVYENLKNQDPSWKEKYPTFEDFWGRVKELSVGQMSQSPNSLDEIPQEMKDINKAYAERVLNMNPDGKITFYRNATNQKGTPEESALGYVTTNADFAYDYNSQAPNINGNGRYEIDVKPDEVFGMIGYSQLEDEFGVVIGRGVTSQPDRVRRVGDLAQPELAPWLEKYQDGVGRSTGSTPYRHYALAGQFDLLPVDPLGNDAAEFLGKHGKTAADIKAKFDELYGEGAYDEYKASDESLGFSDIKRLFVDVGDGKVGLDITRIGGMDGSLAPAGYGNGDPASFKNDKTDNTLKMLSVFQELSGQPFMVHRSRTDELPADIKETATPDVTDGYKPSEYGEVIRLDETDEDEYSDVLNDAIDEYTGMGFNYMNDYLRGNVADVDDEIKAQIDALQEHAMSTTLPEPMSFLRSQTTWGGYDFVQQEDGTYKLEKSTDSGDKEVRSLESIVGEKWESKGFLSTTTELSAGKPLKNRYGKEMKFQLHVLAPAGSHGVTLGFEEREFLMPHGLSYTVVKAEPIDGQAHIWIELDPPTPEATPEVQPQEFKELDNYFADEPEVEGTNSFNDPFTENPDLTDRQENVLEWFTDTGYEQATKFLRAGEDVTEKSKKGIQVLLDLIDDSEVKVDTLIYRGRAYPEEDANQWEELLNLKVGDEYVDRGIASNTTDRQRAAFYTDMDLTGTVGRALFRVVARKGQKGFKIPDNVSSYGSQEQEVLLPPNTKYRVTGINTVEGTRIVDVEIIEQEPKRATVDDYAVNATSEATDPEPEPIVPQKPQPDQALQANYSSKEMSSIYNYIFEDKINETILALKDKPIQSYIDAVNGKDSDVDLDGLTKDQIDAIKAIEGLDSAIANTKFETDTSVHRGIRISPEKFEEFASRTTEGSTWSFSTFSSTSKDPAIAERFATDVEGKVPVVVQFDMPKGSSGLDIDILDIDGGYGDEEEVLLARNAKFEVVSAERKPIGSNGVEGLHLTVRPKVDAPKPKAPIPTPIKPLPKVKPKEKVKVDRSKLPMPEVEVNEPVYNTLNKDKPVYINGFIAVPSSPEADALSKIGKDPSKKDRDALRKKTLEVLTKDPNYKPLPPQDADFDALTSVGESAFTYVDSSLLINNGLRDADPDMENSKQVKDIDEAMTLSAHLPPGSTVYRMLKLSTWERLNPQPGQVLIDRAYSSTSHTKVFSDEARDIDISTGDVNQIPMRIVMPNNTSGIDLSTISWYDTEDEYLLPRNTALRFLGWDSDGYAVFERIS